MALPMTNSQVSNCARQNIVKINNAMELIESLHDLENEDYTGPYGDLQKQIVHSLTVLLRESRRKQLEADKAIIEENLANL